MVYIVYNKVQIYLFFDTKNTCKVLLSYAYG